MVQLNEIHVNDRSNATSPGQRFQRRGKGKGKSFHYAAHVAEDYSTDAAFEDGEEEHDGGEWWSDAYYEVGESVDIGDETLAMHLKPPRRG